MKTSRVLSCALGVMLLLSGCNGLTDENAEPAQSSTARITASAPPTAPASKEAKAEPAPSKDAEVAAVAPSTAPASKEANAPAAVSKLVLDTKVASVTDALGMPLQPVTYEDIAADLDSSQAALESARIEPATCKSTVLENAALARNKAIGGAIGVGAADEFGTALLAVVLDGSTEGAISESFNLDLGQVVRCSPLTMTFGEATSYLSTEKLFQNPIGEESYALLSTEYGSDDNSAYTMTVTARGNGLIASAQSVGTVEPDDVLQDRLADIAAQLLMPSTP